MSPDEGIREFIGKQLAFYQAAPQTFRDRRAAQTIALAEVLRFMDGDLRMARQLEDFIPLTLSDLPERLGGVKGA